MDDPLRPISTLELLDRTLSLYCRNFVVFAGLSIVGPVATFAYRLRYGGGTVALVRLHSSTAEPAVLGGLVGIVIELAGASISSAATVEAAAAVSRGSKVRAAEGYRALGERLWQSIGIVLSVFIRQWAEDLELKYFLTLTLDPSKLEGGMCDAEFAVQYMRIVFNKFRVYLRRQYGKAPAYICVLEFTKAGAPHLHILIDRYIPQAWISDVWASLGGGRICFIKQVKVKHVARYLSKYLTKDLVLSAPKRTRRITRARSIKLFPKFVSDIAWELLKSPIWWNMAEWRCRLGSRQGDLFKYITFEVDEQRFLKYFEVVMDFGFSRPTEPSPMCT